MEQIHDVFAMYLVLLCLIACFLSSSLKCLIGVWIFFGLPILYMITIYFFISFHDAFESFIEIKSIIQSTYSVG